MRKYHFLTIGIFISVFIICSAAIFAFDIKDMTAAKGTIDDFNDGWSLVRPDGLRVDIESLPYSEPSKAGEVFFLEKTIDNKYAGLTMRFLSADKNLVVRLDDEEIYEFGVSDKRLFGKTPGSITNFIELPADLGNGQLSMEMYSPYDGYASNVTNIVIGKKDVVELDLVKSNLVNYFMCMIILFSAFMLIIIELIEVFSKQKFTGIVNLGAICFLGAFYHAIETKSLNIFYGNQTLYSIAVFVIIMALPSLLCQYYIISMPEKYKKRFKINLIVCVVNICLQFLIQICQIADFMVLAPLSHAIIGLTVINVDVAVVQLLIDNYRKNVRISKRLVAEMVGVTSIMLGSVIDIIRFYITPVGDMGKYGRLGMLIFSVITLIIHINMISARYLEKVQENMNLMEEHILEVEKANKSKSMFLANMSHEIRTPMNSIMGFSEILLKKELSDEEREYVENIRESSENLLTIINDILDISKIESGKMEIVENDFESEKLLKGVMSQIKSLADKKDLKFAAEISSDIPSVLYGDEVRIREILINILNNAIKYTNEGSVLFKANVTLNDNNMAEIEFRSIDTGIGINEEYKDVIFHAFEQADKKKNNGIEGTGLGLSIVRSYLELMNGSVEVESEVGKGSTFIVTIPLKIVDSKPIGELILEREKKAKSHISDLHIEKEVLVVDDSMVNLKVIGRTLEHYGITVTAVNSGQKAVDECKDKLFDIVFMDQMMPVMDGVEAMNIIRGIPGYEKGSDHKIVVLTANAIKGAEEELLAAGFDAYLKKPVEFDKMEKILLG